MLRLTAQCLASSEELGCKTGHCDVDDVVGDVVDDVVGGVVDDVGGVVDVVLRRW